MARRKTRWRLFGNPLSLKTRRTSSGSGRSIRSGRNNGWRNFVKLSGREKTRLIFKWLGLFIAGFILFSLLLFAVYAKDLPNPTNISARQVAESTKILDRNGNLLYEIYKDGRRTIVKADEISEYAKKATVAVEDSEFYSHHGVDPISILRAAYYNVFHLTPYTTGGSTITQQFIKNALLTKEKKISRKIKEAILAIEVETIYDKDEILAGYLNEIPYGNNTFGIESASRAYFSKSAKDLTLAESALLASIPQRPSYFSPYGSHLDELFIRKDYVLDRMTSEGYITNEEAEEAKNSSPSLENPNFAERNENIKAPHFVFYVRDKLVEQFGNDQEAELELATSGYTVTTTLDLDVQEQAEKAVAEQAPRAFDRYGASNAAAVAIDPSNGDVLAMVGSIDYFNEEFGSVNVADSLRQPGSSFKPIVYATGFKGEYSPATILFDLRTDFGGGYLPNNYDGAFRGPVTVRQALSWSLNIPAVKMLELVGIDEALKTAHDLGITSLNDRDSYGLSLVLGAGEVKLVELVHAYSTMANQGTKMPLTAILKVEDREGNTLLDITDKEREGKEVLDPQAAFLVSDVLADVATKAPVFGNGLTIGGHTVASKTGTTQSYRDAWTVGYTPQIAFGVWVGNNDNSPMNQGAAGLTVAAPIWRAFMNSYLSDKPNAPFTAPNGVSRVTVDKLSTKLPNSGCSTELIEDWFSSWAKPNEQDNVHQLVKIDKVSGKLATEFTPQDRIEERCYRELHSEIPNKPNWEGPVQAWAQQNGYNADNIPTEYDDVHTATSKPEVTIDSPQSNQEVGSTITVKATIKGERNIDYADYYIDNVRKSHVGESPFEAGISNLEQGEHTLKVVGTDDVGNQGEKSITIIVGSGGNYPGTVSNVKASTNGKNVDISWKNPSNSDLVSVKIYESKESGSLGNLIRTAAASPQTSTYTTLTNHASGTYYYTMRPTDTSGRENPTTAQYIVTVP